MQNVNYVLLAVQTALVWDIFNIVHVVSYSGNTKRKEQMHKDKKKVP